MSVDVLVATRALAAQRAKVLPGSPAALAKRIIPCYVVTPTVALISDALVDAVESPNRRVIITCPPRTGKSVLSSQVLPIWALSRRPDEQVILKSYADQLAEEHSREARRLITESAELLGIELAADKTSAGRWQVHGHRGGLLAGGILTGTTGFGANLLVVDDPVRGATDADSPSMRRRLLSEFRSSLLSRLMPGASCVIIATRWAEDDLPGALLAEEDSPWTWINVPAVSTAGVPDALERERSGVPMASAIGRTAEEFDQIRREVGSRAWAALYCGVPSTPEGSLIRQDWIDQWRLAVPPAGPMKTVIGIDPADSGQGDAAGIVAASLGRDGVISIIADATGQFTAEQWARRAVELAVETGASEIAIESFASGTTYKSVVENALTRMRPGRAIRVTNWPPKGSGRGRGDALSRAAGLIQGLEVGTCRIAGHLPDFEAVAVGWQQHQHQPDCVAAATIAFDVLAHARGQRMTIVSPIDAERRMRESPTPTPPWMRQSVVGHSDGYDPLAYRRGVVGRPRESTCGRPALDVR